MRRRSKTLISRNSLTKTSRIKMYVTVYILVVLTVIEGTPSVKFAEFKTANECFENEFMIESTTMAFAKCVPDKKEQI